MDSRMMPEVVAKQYWSRGGITPEIRKEIETLLSGGHGTQQADSSCEAALGGLCLSRQTDYECQGEDDKTEKQAQRTHKNPQ